MAFIQIEYNDGGKPLAYEAVGLSYGDNEEKVFNSGDFVKDWYDCVKFIVTELPEGESVGYSSSVNHFIMDGAPYSSMYLKSDKKEDAEYEDFYLTDVYESGIIEFFVRKGTKPTWGELKDLCGDPKKLENHGSN